MSESPTTSTVPNQPDELAVKVSFLLRRAFAEPPEAIETHMSWVFLTDDRAYKLKKPVRYPFVDHRTIEARRRDCEDEVRLNEALAPGVYLGTIPLTRDREGTLALDGVGRVVEWLVVMRRVPDRALLDHRLRDDPGSIGEPEIEAFIDHLVGFYRTTTRRPVEPDAHREALRSGLGLDREELLRHGHAIDVARVSRLVDGLERTIVGLPDLGDRGRRLVDGHGDLRPEHVVLGPRPLVLDRITFDDRLRHVDPVYDLALLAVECRLLGATELGERIVARHLERAGDPAPPAVVALYRALRATTRARLSIAHLTDSSRDAGKWLDRTDAYLEIATDELRA